PAARSYCPRQAWHLLLCRLLVCVGQLHGPCTLLACIDLEIAGAVETARQAILGTLDGEFLVARAHEGLSRPFTAAVIIERVDVIETSHQRALQQGFATPRGDVPPALRGPSLRVLVTERDPDPARGVVAQTEVRRRRFVPEEQQGQYQRR